MIQITAYLRTEEDFAKWKSLPNKTEWLHQALSGDQSSGVTAARQEVGSSPTPRTYARQPTQEQVVYTRREEPFVPKPPDPETGYPCCQQTNYRCKHWVWDVNVAMYRNTLTNKIMEAAL